MALFRVLNPGKFSCHRPHIHRYQATEGAVISRWWWQVAPGQQGQGIVNVVVLVFQHPEKLNKISEKLIILHSSYQKWKLTCSSIIRIRNWTKNNHLNIFSGPLNWPSGYLKKISRFSVSLKVKSKKWIILLESFWMRKLTSSSIIRSKNRIKKQTTNKRSVRFF